MPTASSCLAMAPPPAPQDTDTTRTAPAIRIFGPGDAGRDAVEAFIRQVYGRRHGARVRAFMPVLVALHDAGEIVAAAGYRAAGESPLFLERYLSAPVECLLAGAHGAVPGRASIVEVGHLASTQAGEGRRLILALGPHLAARRFQWVVSTVTQELRSLFLRIGITPLTLGAAHAAALGDEAADWGTYYEHAPLVVAGHLPQALRHLAARPRPGAR